MVVNDEIRQGKVILRSGDVFQSDLKRGRKGYFQFLYQDDSFLSGHLIRAFSFTRRTYSSLEEIVNGPVAFFGFTFLFEGLKERYWTRIGSIPVERTFEPPMFKTTDDTKYYVQKSYDWHIWKGNFADAIRIGEMTDEYRDLPDSVLVTPETLVEWLEAGRQITDYLPD